MLQTMPAKDIQFNIALSRTEMKKIAKSFTAAVRGVMCYMEPDPDRWSKSVLFP